MFLNKSLKQYFLCITCLLFFDSPLVFAAENHFLSRVVVSTKPLHSIVAGVMQGVSTPELIVNGTASPHTYRLKPSAARAIQEAGAVFWAGDNVETFLIKPLASLPRQAKVVTLSKAPGIQLLPVRGGEKWESDHDHDHDQADGNGEHEDLLHNIDPHVWLDPVNTKMMVKAIVQTLSEIDPEHASLYLHNGEALAVRLDKLNQALMSNLEPVSGHPYMVFHDAYQYFEKRYHLNAVGSVIFQTDQASSAKRLRRLHKLIEDNNVRCVFSEPEFSPKKVNALIRGTQIKTGVLDSLGSDLPAGPDLYFSMMKNLGKSIKACLGKR